MILSFRYLFNNTFCRKSIIFYVYHVRSCVQLVIALSFIRNMSIALGLASRPGTGRIKKGVWMPSKGKTLFWDWQNTVLGPAKHCFGTGKTLFWDQQNTVLGPAKHLISLVSELLCWV